MDLAHVWFVAIAVIWVGYFVLEGFDFGVGMLLKLLARDRAERRVLINTIGPVWDGNEVWVLFAVGATFAAFPDWYATMFSGFYLPTLLILLALIVRGVAFEYRHKRDDGVWQRNWERCMMVGSLIPPLAWGLIFANLVRGTPIGPDKNLTGSVLDLVSPYALLGAVLMVSVCLTHGAVFVALKTLGDLRYRARRFAARSGLVTAALAVSFSAWTALAHSSTALTWLAAAVVTVASLVWVAAISRGREGWSFVAGCLVVAALVAMIFLSLFPNLMVSSLDPAWSLTVDNAAASPYALKVMTIAAAVMTPVVIGYQGWSYWVFRRRLGTQHMPAEADEQLLQARVTH